VKVLAQIKFIHILIFKIMKTLFVSIALLACMSFGFSTEKSEPRNYLLSSPSCGNYTWNAAIVNSVSSSGGTVTVNFDRNPSGIAIVQMVGPGGYSGSMDFQSGSGTASHDFTGATQSGNYAVHVYWQNLCQVGGRDITL
jgi:hypothetical protein